MPATAATAKPLSMTELARVVIRHFPPEARATAVAIAWHESRGNPAALNDKNNTPAGSRDRGLWQINDHWNPSVTDACAFDPECSTAYAAQLYKSSGWKPWATFKRGAYRPFLEQAEAAVEQAGGAAAGVGATSSASVKDMGTIPAGVDENGGWIPGFPDPGDVIDVATGAVDTVTNAFGFIGKAFAVLTSGDFWKRAGLGLGGLALVGLGIVIVKRDTFAIGAATVAGGPAGGAAASSAVKAKNETKRTADAGATIAPRAAGAADTAPDA